MVEIGPESEKLLRRSLGRLQACVDQLIGQERIRSAGGLGGMDVQLALTTGKVLELLQLQLDNVIEITEQESPSALADGAAWLLANLRP